MIETTRRLLEPALAGAVLLVVSPAVNEAVVINEVVTANALGITDECGEHEDWIEFYNPAGTPAVLDGFGLSDDPTRPRKWMFAHATIPARGYLLVFASGLNQPIAFTDWETLIDKGDGWRYLVPSKEPPVEWRSPTFVDSAWPRDRSGFGYTRGTGSANAPSTTSLYARKTFRVDDPARIQALLLHVDCDGPFVAYLNGREIARADIATSGGARPPFDPDANLPPEGTPCRGLRPQAWIVDDPRAYLSAGLNVLALQVHTESPTDLTLIPYLSVAPASGSGRALSADLRAALPQLHAPFKLAAAGEALVLTDRTGAVIDRVETGQLYADISAGRSPDGGVPGFVFLDPTPGARNDPGARPGFTEPPRLDPAGGFYTGSVTVTISHPDTRDIHYTLDATGPTSTDPIYVAPIVSDTTLVVRARAYSPGELPSPVVTATYLVDEATALAAVSLVTEPKYLWDPEIGIYHPDNVRRAWERPAHIEFWEPDGTPGSPGTRAPAFGIDAGIALHGFSSRMLPQKSLRLVFRGDYGDGTLDYRLFRDLEIGSFRRLILRNSGDDWSHAHLRDALAHRLTRGMTSIARPTGRRWSS